MSALTNKIFGDVYNIIDKKKEKLLKMKEDCEGKYLVMFGQSKFLGKTSTGGFVVTYCPLSANVFTPYGKESSWMKYRNGTGESGVYVPLNEAIDNHIKFLDIVRG